MARLRRTRYRAPGFVLATFVALVVSTLALARFSTWKTVLFAVLFTVALKVLFLTVFYISLPQGFLDELIVEVVFNLTS